MTKPINRNEIEPPTKVVVNTEFHYREWTFNRKYRRGVKRIWSDRARGSGRKRKRSQARKA